MCLKNWFRNNRAGFIMFSLHCLFQMVFDASSLRRWLTGIYHHWCSTTDDSNEAIFQHINGVSSTVNMVSSTAILAFLESSVERNEGKGHPGRTRVKLLGYCTNSFYKYGCHLCGCSVYPLNFRSVQADKYDTSRDFSTYQIHRDVHIIKSDQSYQVHIDIHIIKSDHSMRIRFKWTMTCTLIPTDAADLYFPIGGSLFSPVLYNTWIVWGFEPYFYQVQVQFIKKIVHP
jgi:hypothetical protein